jgi:hypothetical protein
MHGIYYNALHILAMDIGVVTGLHKDQRLSMVELQTSVTWHWLADIFVR